MKQASSFFNVHFHLASFSVCQFCRERLQDLLYFDLINSSSRCVTSLSVACWHISNVGVSNRRAHRRFSVLFEGPIPMSDQLQVHCTRNLPHLGLRFDGHKDLPCFGSGRCCRLGVGACCHPGCQGLVSEAVGCRSFLSDEVGKFAVTPIAL